MVNAERVIVVILMDGTNVIADVQEAVHKETGERQAWVFNYPYTVSYEQPKMEGVGLQEDPEVRVNYAAWCPLTIDTQIAVNTQFVVSIMEPVPSLRDTYVENVRKMGGDVE